MTDQLKLYAMSGVYKQSFAKDLACTLAKSPEDALEMFKKKLNDYPYADSKWDDDKDCSVKVFTYGLDDIWEVPYGDVVSMKYAE